MSDRSGLIIYFFGLEIIISYKYFGFKIVDEDQLRLLAKWALILTLLTDLVDIKHQLLTSEAILPLIFRQLLAAVIIVFSVFEVER